MDSRQGFQLRFPLALWSGALALFSKLLVESTNKYIPDHISGMAGFVRTFPELLDNLRKGEIWPGLISIARKSDHSTILQNGFIDL